MTYKNRIICRFSLVVSQNILRLILFVLLYAGIYFCTNNMASAEIHTVNNEIEFIGVLNDIESGVIIDNDNTIIVAENISLDNSVPWPTADKRIFIQTSGNGKLTFDAITPPTVPSNIKLVIETGNVVFADTFEISSNIEIRNIAVTTVNAQATNLTVNGGMLKVSGNKTSLSSTGNLAVDNNGETIVSGGGKVTANNIVLGETTHGTLFVTGNGSELAVVNPGAVGMFAPTGTGSFYVTDGGSVSMAGTGQIVLNGNVLFDNGRLNQATGTLLDAGSGRIDLDHGSIMTSTGILNAVGGIFVNDNSVLNVAGTNGTLNITGGGLYFSDNSTLGISLGSTDAGKIDAGNGIIALDGNLLVTPEYGYYGDTAVTSAIIGTTGHISGAFNNASLSNGRLGTLTVDYTGTPNEVGITFDPNLTPYSSFTQTFNERSIGQTFDAIHQSQLANFAPLMQAAWNMSDAELQALYNDLSGEIRAHTMAMPLANPGRMAFDRVGWASHTGHVFFGPQYRLASSGSHRATWLRPYYIDNSVKSDGNASKYTLDGYGFVGGIDQALTGGQTAVGVMLGYGRPELKSRSNKAELDDFVIGGYIASRVIEMFELKVWGGYGYQYYDMNRNINYLGTQQSLKSNFKGHSGTFSAELTRPIYVLIPDIPRLVVKPSVGYDYTYLQQKAGDETGNHIVALAYDKTKIERHIGRAGVSAEYGDSARSLYGGAHYKYLLGGDEIYYSQASFIGGGPSFVVQSADLGKAFISANIGMQINLSDDRSRLLFVDYNVDFGDNDTRYQTATFGLQQTF